MAQQFSGRVVVVTGSSAGIGEAVALLFASRGAKVTFTGRDHARLGAAVDKAVQLSGRGRENFLSVQGDVTESAVREEIVQKTIQSFGRLDVLVLNAGVPGEFSPFLTISEQIYDTVLNTNLKSVFFLTQLAIPHLEATKGNIITISSIVSSIPHGHGIPYGISKAALDHLTRCLAVDLGSKGIRVNSVNPGYFPTMIMRDFGQDFEKLIAKLDKEVRPLKGRDGVLQDVAEAVAYLASDTAGFVTGVHLKVDGGGSFSGLPDASKIPNLVPTSQ